MLTPSNSTRRDPLQVALAEFEAAVEIPFVPGELEAWIDAVDSAFEPVRAASAIKIEQVHPEQFHQIRREDQGLNHRVDQMAQEDSAIDRHVVDLGRRIARLKPLISAVEPDEAALNPDLQSLVDAALDLVIRSRRQEQAIRTWLLEAFNRDRGTVD